MCSVSSVNDMLGSLNTTSGGVAAASIEQVSGVKLQHDRDKFWIIDIREPDEIAQSNTDSDAQISLGKLLTMKPDELDGLQKKDKKVVLLCNSGYRASIAAPELAKKNVQVAVLSRGILGLSNPAATVPDFLVVLGTKSNAERITLALTAAATAASNGETVVLVLMGEGVCTFLRKGNNKIVEAFVVEETFIGEPFGTCDSLLQKFIGTGNGLVLACKSCVKHRKIEFGSDLLDCVQPMQMPDLLRMLGEAKKTLQFI